MPIAPTTINVPNMWVYVCEGFGQECVALCMCLCVERNVCNAALAFRLLQLVNHLVVHGLAIHMRNLVWW